MTIPNLNDDERKKLSKLFDEGCRVLAEIDALKEGLKDTVSSISEEMDINKATLNKAIRMSYKADFHSKKQQFDELDELLEVLKKK